VVSGEKMVEKMETTHFQLKFPVLRGLLLGLLAGVVLVFSFVSIPKPGFAVILIMLLLFWAVTFYLAGVYQAADIPILFLILGTFTWGKAFSLLGINVANLPLYVTDIVLAVSLGLLFLERKSLKKLGNEWRLPLPKGLAAVMAAYFLLGMLYLVIGVMGNGFLALRDIVFCLYLLFLFITLNLLGNPARIKKLMPVMMLAVIFLLFTSLLIFFTYLPDSSFRDFIKEIKMTNLGLYCGLIVMFGLSFYTVFKKKVKLVAGIFIYLGFLFVVMAEVRAAWAGMLVSLILLGILLKKEFKIFILIFLLVVASIFIIDYFDLGVQKDKLASVAEQLKSITQRRHQDSMPAANIKWRLDIWKQTIDEIKEYPIFGWGYGTQIDYEIWTQQLSWLKAIGANTGVLPPHNHLIAITYKMGLVGLALFLFINFRVFFYGLGYIKKCKSEFNRRFLIASLAGLVYWHGMAFFFDVLESPPTGIFLWILLGCILGVVYADRRA
jgi:O-antigen ligase